MADVFNEDLMDILKMAKADGAEEIYLEPGFPVAYKGKDGGIVTAAGKPKPLSPMEIKNYLVSLASERNRQLLHDRGSVNFSHSVPGVSRYYVSIANQRGTPYIVLKRIKNVNEGGLITLDKETQELCNNKEGLIIVCGKKGSGRSTLGISLVDYIVKNRNTTIVTLESPIQLILQHSKSIVNQREKYTDYTNTEETLLNIGKENPGVIFIDDNESDNVIYEACHLSMGRLVILNMFGDDVEKVKAHIYAANNGKTSYWTKDDGFLGFLVAKKDEEGCLLYDLHK